MSIVRTASRSLPFLLVLTITACRQDMHNQPKYKSLAETDFFGDGRSARPPIPDTVARGQLRTDAALYSGKVGDADVAEFPFAITRDSIDRGHQRFDIYCSPCHGRLGDGRGLVAQRGFRKPPASYHIDRLRQAPVGHFFDVMTNGFGAMPSYASKVVVEDRWRIIAYIRVLQLSQQAVLADVPPEQRSEIQNQD